MVTYESMQDLQKGACILSWWKANEARLPLLSSLARSILAIPVSGSKSERTFSKAGLYVTPKRKNLSDELVEDMVIIATNLDQLDISDDED